MRGSDNIVTASRTVSLLFNWKCVRSLPEHSSPRDLLIQPLRLSNQRTWCEPKRQLVTSLSRVDFLDVDREPTDPGPHANTILVIHCNISSEPSHTFGANTPILRDKQPA